MNRELIEAARLRGGADVDRLIEAAWPDAYRLARAVLGDAHAAADVAQESCVVLYRSIGSLRSADAFRVWMYRIVVREAGEYKRRGTQHLPDATRESYVEDATDALDVWRALSALPHHLREVIVLRYFEDLSSREIAAVLRIPDSSVRFRLMIARRRLRPMLGEAPEAASSFEGEAHAL